jgi:hypothetical protein
MARFAQKGRTLSAFGCRLQTSAGYRLRARRVASTMLPPITSETAPGGEHPATVDAVSPALVPVRGRAGAAAGLCRGCAGGRPAGRSVVRRVPV